MSLNSTFTTFLEALQIRAKIGLNIFFVIFGWVTVLTKYGLQSRIFIEHSVALFYQVKRKYFLKSYLSYICIFVSIIFFLK